MGRIAYADESLFTYLTSLMKPDGYTIGLILGQSTEQKDFVVHLARTPPPATKDVIEETLISSTTTVHPESAPKYIKSVNDIQESWVADHAKHVTRMLPGGMWVLGLFIVGPKDILADGLTRLRSVILAIRKTLGSNEYLYGNNEQENLVLSCNSITRKYVCKSLDNQNNTFKPADWKFQSKAMKWHQLEVRIDFDQLFPVPTDTDPETLKTRLQGILEYTSTTVNKAIIVIEGELRSGSDLVEMIGKKKQDVKDKKNSEDDSADSIDKALQAVLYIPCPKTTSQDIKVISCSESMRLVGQLFSKTFVHERASIDEATKAIKQDILRSLASRLEMHWDSLIEEENGSPEDSITLHEPPRRVLVALPQSKVTLSDYLFPGEGAQEALISLQELLDLKVQENSVQKDLEFQVDPPEFYCQNDVDKASDHGKDPVDSNQLITYVAGLSIALFALIVAFLIHHFS
ncbi:protein odr-4 homolog [Orussus abietinus]|uniref:protein odr-4 homolog n=1 Tax=Orussus abietinus TaxID=222816 RepID=UPI000625B4FE|nr:protein odr-4 homolog [Orussus abietinus]